MRDSDSILITSAPRLARMRHPSGPASTHEIFFGSTRKPASGELAAIPPLFARRPLSLAGKDATITAVSAPRSGAGPKELIVRRHACERAFRHAAALRAQGGALNELSDGGKLLAFAHVPELHRRRPMRPRSRPTARELVAVIDCPRPPQMAASPSRNEASLARSCFAPPAGPARTGRSPAPTPEALATGRAGRESLPSECHGGPRETSAVFLPGVTLCQR